MLTASCSLSEFDFARSGGSLENKEKVRNQVIAGLRITPSMIL